MSKTIWRFDNRSLYGKISLDKFTVVYENKTYYYCKVSGSDELERLLKEIVETSNNFIISVDGNAEEYIKEILSEKFNELKKKNLYTEINKVSTMISTLTGELDRFKKRAEELEVIRLKEGFE